METPKFAKRSACDRCRQKRLRCPRTGDSNEPCARCLRIGAPCATGAPGLLGRPRKTPTHGPQSPPCAAIGSPSHKGVTSPPEGRADLGLHASWDGGLTLAESPAAWSVVDMPSNLLVDLEPAMVYQPTPPSKFVYQHHSDTWLSNHDFGDPFGYVSAEDASSLRPPSSRELANVVLHEQSLLGGDSIRVRDPGHVLSDSFGVGARDSSVHVSSKSSTQRTSSTIQLLRFFENLRECCLAMDSIIKSERLAQNCFDSTEWSTANPVTLLILRTKEFTEIVQTLQSSEQSAQEPSNTITPAALLGTGQGNSLSTPTLLLLLSNYLQLMQIYASFLCTISRILREIPAEMIKSARVKAALCIGGMPSMEDISANTYAKGVVDVLQRHIQELQHCLGLPARYCLSGKTGPTLSGIFSSVDLAPLLQIVMAQDDVRSSDGGESHVESVRESINTILETLEK